MTARTPSQHADSADTPAGRDAAGWTSLPAPLRLALGLALLGGLVLAIAPLLPVVSPAESAGFDATPLLLLTGVLPVVVAIVFAVRGRLLATGGALIAAALFAPGRLLADLQLAVDSSSAQRPELLLPQSLTTTHAAIGLWLLIVGHVLVLAAGAVAAPYAGLAERGARAAADTFGTGATDPATTSDAGSDTGFRSAAAPAGAEADRPGGLQGTVMIGLCLGALTAVGLVATPFTSADPYLIAKDVLDAPLLARIGGLLIAVAVLGIGLLAMAMLDREAIRGWLYGGAAAVAAVALPELVSGLAVPDLGPTAGPYVALAGALGLVVLGAVAGGDGRRAAANRVEQPAELVLPGQARLHLATGLIGLVSAVAALVGATTSLYVLPAGLPHNTSSAGHPLIPAGILIGGLALAMLRPRWAPVVRPAFAVAFAAVVLAGLDAVDTTLSATQIDGVSAGFGSWATVVAIVTAVVAACCAGVAGGVERDDVDLTEVHPATGAIGPVAAAVLLGIGAFGLPVLRASGYVEPGLWSNFKVESWGLLFGLVAVLVAAALAPMCRPNRGAALLLGAAGVVLVRALELPLTRASAQDSTAGPGFWLALAAAAALVVSAITMVVTGRRPSPARRVTTRRDRKA